MDRREFLKVTGAGALTLFLSGCGINAVSGDKKAGRLPLPVTPKQNRAVCLTESP